MASDEKEAASGAVRSSRGAYATAASVVLLAVGSWVAWPRIAAWSSWRRTEDAFHETIACIDTELDVEGIRRRAVAAEVASSDWPTPCSPALTQLSVSAQAAARARASCGGECCSDDAACGALQQLHHLASELRGDATPGGFVAHHAHTLGELGQELGWPVTGGKPPSTKPLGVSGLAPLTQLPLARAALCKSGDAAWWLMVQHERRGTTLCGVDLEKAHASCSLLPPTVPARGDVFLIDGGQAPWPAVLAGADGAWSVHRANGDPLVVMHEDVTSATTLASGSVALLLRRGDTFAVAIDDKTQFELQATSPPLIYGGHVVAQEDKAVVAYDLPSGAKHPIGTLASDRAASMRACSTAAVTAVRLRDGVDRGGAVAMFRRGAWTFETLDAAVPASTMSCHGEDVHFTWLDTLEAGPVGEHGAPGRYLVNDVVCAPAGCRLEQGEVALERHDQSSRFFVASLGEQLALVWRSGLGDVRLRIGELRRLSQQPVVTLFDDGEHGGLTWDGRELRLLSADRAAVLLIDDDGVYGVVIDRMGARALMP